ncbi:hypothetical protein EVAR_32457_1 [Eumeta japonica]|uniref:Uncharacterized protein n=1 Tax=Eumeta variegata TaxID=151549 RepID=A0A4C1VLL2_EUMVA|nr:hypothetical protein EVAR_32457_1 [Eumeta japonica]
MNFVYVYLPRYQNGGVTKAYMRLYALSCGAESLVYYPPITYGFIVIENIIVNDKTFTNPEASQRCGSGTIAEIRNEIQAGTQISWKIKKNYGKSACYGKLKCHERGARPRRAPAGRAVHRRAPASALSHRRRAAPVNYVQSMRWLTRRLRTRFQYLLASGFMYSEHLEKLFP